MVYAIIFDFTCRGNHWSSANKITKLIEIFVRGCNFVDRILYKFFITIRNCSNRPRRFALFGYKKNNDRRAVSSGRCPLFHLDSDNQWSLLHFSKILHALNSHLSYHCNLALRADENLQKPGSPMTFLHE